MTKMITIASWDSPRKVLCFTPDNEGYKWIRSSRKQQLQAGFAKSCINGHPILVYQLGKTWIFQVNNIKTRLSDPKLLLSTEEKRGVTILDIRLGNTSKRKYFVPFFHKLSLFFDPTYDAMDRDMNDFCYWLTDLKEKEESRGH